MDRLTRFAAAAVLLALVPALLLRFAGNPLSMWRVVHRGPFGDGAVVAVLAIAIWLLWAVALVRQLTGLPELLSVRKTFARDVPPALVETPSQAEPSSAVSTVPAPSSVLADSLRRDGGTRDGRQVAHVETRSVVVRHLDNLYSIAERHLGQGSRWTEIAALNLGRTMSDGTTFADPERIREGWALVVPAAGFRDAIAAPTTVRPRKSTVTVAAVGEGELFGRYLLERKLGQGGMGVVFAARDTALDRVVALKIVAPHLAHDAEFRARFEREAATQARLDSPRVVRIYDFGEIDGVLFLSTEFIDGRDLSSLIESTGVLAPADTLDILICVLEALQTAHAAGVIHRDVKPANILVRDGTSPCNALLCDFGIATMDGMALTQVGEVIGSLPWMAPERHYGRPAEPRGDLYAVGCVLWYLLTGLAPYGGTDGEVLMGHLEGPIPQFEELGPLASVLNPILMRSLAKDPNERYAGAQAMLDDLRSARGMVQRHAISTADTVVRPRGPRPGDATV